MEKFEEKLNELEDTNIPVITKTMIAPIKQQQPVNFSYPQPIPHY